MELCTLYMSVWRKDPVRMREQIKAVKEDIKRIVDTYSNNVQASYPLKRDLTQYITGYLINKGVADLFTFQLNRERKGWGAEFFVADVQFAYEREDEE